MGIQLHSTLVRICFSSRRLSSSPISPLLFRSLPTLFFFFFPENSFFSYFFAINCQNNFSYQEKLELQESAPLTQQRPKNCVVFLVILVQSVYFFLFATFIKSTGYVILPQMNVWINPEPPTLCYKFPTFFLLFSYFYISEGPTFLLLFQMKSFERLFRRKFLP